MTTETTEAPAIDVPKLLAEREVLASRLTTLQNDIVKAASMADMAAIGTISKALADTQGEITKLDRRIARATNAPTGNTKERLEAKDAAVNALREWYDGSGEPVRALASLVKGVKAVRINFVDGAFDSIDVVGGFRTVTATNIHRTRAVWTGGSLRTAELSSKEAVIRYGQKHGATKEYGAMSPAERQALLRVVVEKEKLVNKAAAVETPAS